MDEEKVRMGVREEVRMRVKMGGGKGRNND